MNESSIESIDTIRTEEGPNKPTVQYFSTID